MAEAALKKLEEQLNCLICLDTYTDPKQLQCHHVFCRKCLVKLVVKDQQGQLTLTCPTCRQVTPVPANGVAGLQSAFNINHLLEIVEEHKKATTPASASTDKAESDSASTPHGETTVCCHEHGEKVDLYCATCEEPICLKCVVKSGKHFGHETELLGEAFECYKKEITSSLEPMEKQLVTIKKALAQLDTRCGEISDQQAAIEVDIHERFRKLREVLTVRETELISQLHQTTQGKLKGLAVQRDQIETTLAQLSSCLEFVRESLKTGSEREVLMMKTTIVKRVKELTTTFQPDILKPNTEADVVFSTLQDLTTMCQNYGRVLTQGLPDPSKCRATGKGVEIAVVGEKSTAILQTYDRQDQPCEGHVMLSECELVSEITGTRARGSIESRGRGQYEISYQPTIKGRHQLHVKVEGQHIRGSPFTVAVKSPVEKLGTPILTIYGVEEPCGVAITQRGEVLVTEMGTKQCVSVFSPSGEKLRSFGSHGSGQGQFDYPYGVAVDNEGNILVADRWNHRIQKFTTEGQFLTTVGTKRASPLQFSRPYGIAVNTTNNKVYVGDSHNHRVQVLNSDLTFSSTFGKQGSDEGQFKFSRGIACDSSGNVYVVDDENYRIQVFTAEGKFLRMFGRRGEGRGELISPDDISMDASNMVYVTDYGNHRVSVFTSEGQFVTSFGKHCEGPRGVAVDNSGVVYVCDGGNNRVQLF